MIPVYKIHHLFYIFLGVRVVDYYLKSIEPHKVWLLESFNDFNIVSMAYISCFVR